MAIPVLKANTQADVKILEKKTVYQGFFQVKEYEVQHRLFSGGWSLPLKREVVDKCGAAAVLLHDPVLNKLVLIEQFRIGTLADPDGPWLIELVAGILEVDEAPETLVIRETREEAGLEIRDLQFICRYWVTPGFSNEQVTLFYSKVDAHSAGGIHGLSDEGEDIRVIVVSPEEAYEALEKGQIKNAPTIIALQWLKFHVSEAR